MKWKIQSSNKQTKEPEIVVAHIGDLRITVHRYIHCPNFWFLSTVPGFFDIKELESKDLESAKIEALKCVLGVLQPIVSEISFTVYPAVGHRGML
jgi:hypothetical protein